MAHAASFYAFYGANKKYNHVGRVARARLTHNGDEANWRVPTWNFLHQINLLAAGVHTTEDGWVGGEE